MIPGLIAPQSQTPSAKAAQTPADFTNLINLLLSPTDTSQSAADAAPANSSSTDGSDPEVDGGPQSATPLPPASQIADSLIRSMLSAPSNVAMPSRKVAPSPAQDVTQQPPAASPADNKAASAPVLNAVSQLPLMQPAMAARGPANPAPKSNAPTVPGIVISPAVSKAAQVKSAPAPLAFGLRLTPTSDPSPAGSLNTQAPAREAAPAPVAEPNPEVPSPQSAEPSSSVAEPQQQPDVKPPDAKQPTDSTGIKTRPDPEPREDAAPAAVTAVAGAAMNDASGSGFLNTPQNAASLQSTSKIQAGSAPSAIDALRASEPAAPAAQPAAPVREIAVRIASPQAPAVDVHLVERAGQINVAVRTPDGGLQTSLRQDLGSLVNSLERAGYRAEAFTPREGVQQTAVSAQTNFQNGRQESQSGSGGRNGAYEDPSQNPGGQQQQRQRDPRSQKWIEELEKQQ